MHWTVSLELEQALWDAASELLPPHTMRGATLREAIVARSRRYTSERERLHASLKGTAAAADLAARALFFTPSDAAKIAIPLAELKRAGQLPASIRMFDVGAGVGAMGLGVLDFVHRYHGAPDNGGDGGDSSPVSGVSIHALDCDGQALELYRRAAGRFGELCGLMPPQLAVSVADVTKGAEMEAALHAGAGQAANLIVLGHVLNELSASQQQVLVRDLLARLPQDGALIIVEPALRQTSRAVHQLRDWILQHKLARVFAPCVRDCVPCPALADADDWCHEDRPTSLPPRTSKLAAATGLRAHGLKFAYLTLRPNGRPNGLPSVLSGELGPERGGQSNQQWHAAASSMHLLRVVSHLQNSKGKRVCMVCGQLGRHPLRLLKRHRSADNGAFERVRRGDLLLAPRHAGDLATTDAVDVVRLRPDGKADSKAEPA